MSSKEIQPSREDWALQSNALSRSAYRMPVMLRRIVHLALSHVRTESPREMDVTMNAGEVLRALDLSDQGNRYQQIRGAFNQAIELSLHIEHDNGAWELYTWFSKIAYEPESDSIRLRFNPELHPYLVGFQKSFQRMNIADFAKLQGRYSIRIFEWCMSYAGFAGKDGNKAGCWFVPEITLEGLRHLFQIDPHEYKKTGDLRRRVIDDPIREINSSDLGIEVTPEYKRRGRRLLGVRLKCRYVSRSEPRKVSPKTEAETELDRLIRENPETWEAAQRDAAAQKDLFPAWQTEQGYAIQLFEKYVKKKGK